MAYETNKKVKIEDETYRSNEKKANRDPITGEPGSHPVSTGVGAAVGAFAGITAAAAVGAATGAAMGPVGAIVGAAAGGIFGGGVGHAIGEDFYPTQLAWWKENYSTRPYVPKGAAFDAYEPAYRYGIDASIKYKDRDFNEFESDLSRDWETARGDSYLEWNEAKHASRDAYDRLKKSQA
jgi:hypothetical protein